jgi:hypothetical protein
VTLADITMPVTYAWGVQHALLFSPQLAQRLGQLHAQYGRPDCLATPRLTTDGRYMLTADILTAVVPGGYLHAMWERADKAVLLPAVEVVPIADAVLLIPSPTPIPEGDTFPVLPSLPRFRR